MKRSKAESGKLGALASQAIHQANKQKRIAAHAKKCPVCDTTIPYEKRINNFCSRSCSAKFNNVGVRRHGASKIPKTWKATDQYHITDEIKRSIEEQHRSRAANCKHCDAAIVNRWADLFCSSSCSVGFKRDAKVREWLAGDLVGHCGKTKQTKMFIREYMLQEANYSCSICGWNKRHPVDNKPLVEVDHIDGDSSNTVKSNLRVLCPNCHSETPTFRGRNKNSARER